MMKSILFNNEETRAILNGEKTTTRRVIRPQPEQLFTVVAKPPYCIGDILYVRETWAYLSGQMIGDPGISGMYFYRADGDLRPIAYRGSWNSSTHMPKDAARIFLRVTNLRAHRLQDISPVDLQMEGIKVPQKDEWDCEVSPEAMRLFEFQRIWEDKIKKKDREHFGWDANPWVWVIEFEQISREDAEREG